MKTPQSANESLYRYLLQLGDNSLILGHRLSELCGHGPSLETDMALTNISLDLFGQVRNLFQYAATINEDEATEDTVAFLRTERQYYNCILVEQPNLDFAHIMVRQFLFDAYQQLELRRLSESTDETIAAISVKSLKETDYHVRFSSEWVKRLGDRTEVSHNKMQEAVNHLFPFAHELYTPTPIDHELINNGIGFNSALIKEEYLNKVQSIFEQATLQLPDLPQRFAQGKTGMHTEHLGHILSDLQYMQRTYPNMQW